MKKSFLLIAVIAMASGMAFAAIQPVIADDRSKVDDGRSYFTSRSFIAVTQNFYISTGTRAPRLSLSLDAWTTGTAAAVYASVVVSESAVLSSTTQTGTAMTFYNCNRANGVTGTTFTISHSPASLSSATVTLPTFYGTYGGSTATRNYNIVSPGRDTGFVLKPSTKYYIVVTPSSALYNTVVRFNWQE